MARAASATCGRTRRNAPRINRIIFEGKRKLGGPGVFQGPKQSPTSRAFMGGIEGRSG